MRFGFVHRLMTNALAALGVLALVSSGQFSTVVSIIVLLGMGLALAVRESWQRHRYFRHVDTVVLLLIVGIQVTRFVLGASSLDVIIEFAAALQIVRLATRRGAAHDQQVIVLSLLHLIAGTVLGGGLGYGICFALVLIVAPAALVLSHLRREVEGNYRQGARDRTGLPVDVPRILRSRRVVGRTFLMTMCMLSVPIFIFTAILFVFFPRVGLSLLLVDNQRSDRIIGFTDKVELDGFGKLRDNPTPVMRVTLDPMPDPPPEQIALHLRGSSLDKYDGRGWSRTDDVRRPDGGGESLILLEPPRAPASNAPTMAIDLEPIDPPVLFLPPDAVAFRLNASGVVINAQPPSTLRGPDGEFRYHTDERGIRYTVYRSKAGRASFAKLDDRDRYLQLPSNLSARIRALAAEWTTEATTDEEKAKAIEQHLREDFLYDPESPSGGTAEPLDHFLFESKRGHCEFFSTAMAVMLRTVGVPTRNVMGFGAGTFNKMGGFYTVRQGDAHSWVEAYIDGKGWVTFDPTPSVGALPQPRSKFWATIYDFFEATSERWRRHIVSYDLHQQYDLLRRFSGKDKAEAERSGRNRTIYWVIGIAAVGAVAIYVATRRARLRVARPASVEPRSRSLLRATAIYESLEAALGSKGIHRPPGTPPLRHAENLVASSHPLAQDVLDITQVYLAIRFGNMPLTAETSQDLERRVRAIRQRDLKAES